MQTILLISIKLPSLELHELEPKKTLLLTVLYVDDFACVCLDFFWEGGAGVFVLQFNDDKKIWIGFNVSSEFEKKIGDLKFKNSII